MEILKACSDFGFSDTEDVPLSAIVRAAFSTLSDTRSAGVSVASLRALVAKLARDIGTVQTVLARKQVTRTSDDDAQALMLEQWQATVSELAALLTETT